MQLRNRDEQRIRGRQWPDEKMSSCSWNLLPAQPQWFVDEATPKTNQQPWRGDACTAGHGHRPGRVGGKAIRHILYISYREAETMHEGSRGVCEDMRHQDINCVSRSNSVKPIDDWTRYLLICGTTCCMNMHMCRKIKLLTQKARL